jgi:DNA-directed RNA polymerase specialized sigma24 family protein
MVLRYGAGLPAPEVAALVGLDAANVRKICQRQRAGLLAMLQAGEATEAARAEPGSSLEVRS